MATTGVVVASYPRYVDAQAAVDRLSDERFPVEETSMVGRDLRLVETVTGRLSWGRAALAGAAAGAWFGLLAGLFIGLFADDAGSMLALVLWGLLFGALAGAVFGLVSYAATGGRRDFVSTSQLVAAQYDLVVDARSADEARRVLGLTSADPVDRNGRRGLRPGRGGRAGVDRVGADRAGADRAAADRAAADRAGADRAGGPDRTGDAAEPADRTDATGRVDHRAVGR